MSLDSNAKKVVLLLNLGTPEAPEPEAVGRYLEEFLMDKWVLDIHPVLRWFLVHVLIVPKRKFKSSEAYRKIWTTRGSPLMTNTVDLATALQARTHIPVRVAMRYGEPSLKKVLADLQERGIEQITLLPLYPQFADSSTTTAINEFQKSLSELKFAPQVKIIPPFYRDPGFIKAYAEVIHEAWTLETPDHLLMSFHGLPERHIRRLDPTGQHCFANAKCCDEIVLANQNCYRAQCFATARLLAAELKLERNQFTVSFQSRLGRTPWIRPFTDEVFQNLAENGVKRLAVVCPSFTSDCLETLEEIGLRGRADFKSFGGSELVAIPCLNASSTWVEAIARLVQL